MFAHYGDWSLFYDRKPHNLNLEYEFGHHIPMSEYDELFLLAEYHRLAARTPERGRAAALRIRLAAWLAELDCRLRSRVLRQPCAQPVSVR